VIEGKLYQERATKNHHDLNAFYEKYQEQLNKYEQFKAAHANIEPTVKAILKYIIETIRFLASLKPNSSTLFSPSEFNSEDVIFRLTGKVASVVKELPGNKDDIDKALNLLFKEPNLRGRENDIRLLGVVQTISDNSVDTYAKIGGFADIIPNISIPKPIRIAIGLDIMKYTLNELRVLLAADGVGKTSSITVYIHA